MRRAFTALAALAGIMLLVALLYFSVSTFTFSTASYPQTPPYDAMAEELTAYLSGKQPALSQTLFTERERLHMDDVLVLFQGGRTLGMICLWGGLAFAAVALIGGGRRRLGTGLLIGIGITLGIAAFIGIWAAIDFNGWFTFMHELVFTNDLWLLDPAESMLINMLPLDFFIRAVQTIALRFGVGLVTLVVLAFLARLPFGKKERV